MRTQECRENIDKAAEACDLTPSAVRKVKQALKFVEDHPGNISQMATDAVLVLAKEPDKKIQNLALTTTENLVESGQRPSAREVKEILSKAKGEKPAPDPLARVTTQMRTKPPIKPPIEQEPPRVLPSFDLKKRFPQPGTREEILLRGQLDDIGMRTKGWMKNPDLTPLLPALQELRRKTREVYGDLAGPE